MVVPTGRMVGVRRMRFVCRPGDMRAVAGGFHGLDQALERQLLVAVDGCLLGREVDACLDALELVQLALDA
jgi:hypothetical protein